MQVSVQAYICPVCGVGTVKFRGWGEDVFKTYYHVLACDGKGCEYDEWRKIPYRDFPGDVHPDLMFFKPTEY